MSRERAPQLLTVREVQERLHLSKSEVYELIRSGELPSLKIGAARRIPELELAPFIEEHRA